MVSINIPDSLLGSFAFYSAVVLSKTMAMSLLTAFKRIKNSIYANPEDAATLALPPAVSRSDLLCRRLFIVNASMALSDPVQPEPVCFEKDDLVAQRAAARASPALGLPTHSFDADSAAARRLVAVAAGQPTHSGSILASLCSMLGKRRPVSGAQRSQSSSRSRRLSCLHQLVQRHQSLTRFQSSSSCCDDQYCNGDLAGPRLAHLHQQHSTSRPTTIPTTVCHCSRDNSQPKPNSLNRIRVLKTFNRSERSRQARAMRLSVRRWQHPQPPCSTRLASPPRLARARQNFSESTRNRHIFKTSFFRNWGGALSTLLLFIVAMTTSFQDRHAQYDANIDSQLLSCWHCCRLTMSRRAGCDVVTAIGWAWCRLKRAAVECRLRLRICAA
uniref:Transmembrane protein n=1 Tax=Macrostomum lignano TaxID=282301 RepID=A0A1I8FL70_9PLAT